MTTPGMFRKAGESAGAAGLKPMPPGKHLPMYRKVLYAVIPALFVAGLLETTARIVEVRSSTLQVDVGHGFDPESRLFVKSPLDPGRLITNPAKLSAFKNQEFTAVKQFGTLRIFVIGESSVNFLDQEFRRMEEELKKHYAQDVWRVEVINCGGLSYGSQRLVPVTAEISAYQPDVIILYLGNNEFEELEQLDLAAMDTLFVQKTASRSAALRLCRDFIARRKIASLQSEHNRRILSQARPNWSRAWKHRFTPEEVEQRMQAFERNLQTMAQIGRRSGTQVLIGTIPSNLVRPYLPKEEWRKYEAVTQLMSSGDFARAKDLAESLLEAAPARHQSSRRENAIIRQVAEQLKLPSADVEGSVAGAEPHGIPGETLFIDHCHLSRQGRRIWLDTVTSHIRGLDITGGIYRDSSNDPTHRNPDEVSTLVRTCVNGDCEKPLIRFAERLHENPLDDRRFEDFLEARRRLRSPSGNSAPEALTRLLPAETIIVSAIAEEGSDTTRSIKMLEPALSVECRTPAALLAALRPAGRTGDHSLVKGFAAKWIRMGADEDRIVGTANYLADRNEELAALRLLEAGLDGQPNRAKAHNAHARILATTEDARLRDPGAAEREAREVVQTMQHPNAYVLHTLALSLAAHGKTGEARNTGEKAAQLAAAAGLDELTADIRMQLRNLPVESAD